MKAARENFHLQLHKTIKSPFLACSRNRGPATSSQNLKGGIRINLQSRRVLNPVLNDGAQRATQELMKRALTVYKGERDSGHESPAREEPQEERQCIQRWVRRKQQMEKDPLPYRSTLKNRQLREW
jgi:hypothetical protein